MKKKWFRGLPGIMCFGLWVGFCQILPAEMDLNGPEAPVQEKSNRQVAVSLSQKESVSVTKIDVHCAEPQTVNHAFIRMHVGFHEGQEVDAKRVEMAIKNLYATGSFKKVNVTLRALSEGKVAVVIDVEPFYKIRKVDFKGNVRIKDKELMAEISSRTNTPLDKGKLTKDLNKLKNFYEAKGYLDVEISFEVGQQAFSGYKDIAFNVKEGMRYHIADIKFEGNKSIKTKELLEVMQSKTWDWLSWLMGTGRFKNEMFQMDLERLVEYYQNKGFLDVLIDPTWVRLEKKKSGHLTVVIPLVEGQCYKVGAIVVQGGHIATEKIREVLKVKSGEVFSPEKIELSCENIRDFYGKFGYLETDVTVHRVAQKDSPYCLDIQFDIVEGIQFRIHSIYVTGNTLTQSRVILRELTLAPGDIFDRTRMKRAHARLQNTGHFKTVSLNPESTNLPDRKNLKIGIEEGKTGSVFFSGAFNSVEKFTFGVTLSQNNFDYKKPSNFFRGAGQKFQIGTQIGKYSNEISLSFEEPWLFDRELRFGFNLFRTGSKYLSSAYDEVRLGGEVYLSKRLFEQVVGKLYYRLEEVNLKNMKEDKLPDVIIREKGKRSLSKVGFLMSRDTRDTILYPTEGTLFEWDNQLAGGPVRGQTNYLRSRFTAARWFLVSPENEQVVLLGGKTGSLKGFGGKEVPLFEKEFLGGPDDLRGFDFREVGPKSNDRHREPLGGKTFTYGKAEYSIKIHSIVRLVSFFDVGFVNEKALDWRTKNYNSDWGVGVRLFVLNAPFRLDFAFPLKTDPYNKKKAPHISWSFGVSF